MPESKTAIREASSGDAALVAKFVHSLLDELSSGGAPALPDLESAAEAVLRDETVHGLLAFLDQAPVGLVMLNQCAAVYAGGRFGEITELYVLPEQRSKGVARLLLAAAADFGRRAGWRRLEVGAPDQPAWKRTLDFYLREGFEEVGPRLRKLI